MNFLRQKKKKKKERNMYTNEYGKKFSQPTKKLSADG